MQRRNLISCNSHFQPSVRLFSPSPLITLIVKTVHFLPKEGRATQAVGLDERHYAADVSACMSELLHYVLHVTLTTQVRCLNGETKQIWKLCKVGSVSRVQFCDSLNCPVLKMNEIYVKVLWEERCSPSHTFWGKFDYFASLCYTANF